MSNRAQNLAEEMNEKVRDYLDTPSPTSLNAAIDFGVEAIRREPDAIQDGNQDSAKLLMAVSSAFEMRYKLWRRMGDLDEAIGHAEQAVAISPPGHDSPRAETAMLARLLDTKFTVDRDVVAITKLMKVHERILETLKPESSVYGISLSAFCDTALRKFNVTRQWRDLEDALRIAKLSLPSISKSPSDQNRLIASITSLYDAKYEATKNVSDLKEAVNYSDLGFLSLPTTPTSYGMHLGSHLERLEKLVNRLQMSSEMEGVVRGAETYMRPVTQETPDGVRIMRCYGQILSKKYQLSAEPADLLRLLEQTINSLTPTSTAPLGPQNPFALYVSSLTPFRAKVARLAEAPSENPIVSQVKQGIWREYCSKCQSNDYMLALAMTATVHKTVVRVLTSNPSTLADLPDDEVLTRVRFAKSIGGNYISLSYLLESRRGTNPEVTRAMQERMARLERLLQNDVNFPDNAATR
jgi:hypothetical protein